MTYEENVQRIAEEMAKENNPLLYDSRDYEFNVSVWNYSIQYFKPAARIALKHMAEEVSSLWDYDYESGFPTKEQWLAKNGPIPAQECNKQENKKNEKDIQ